jgi:virginiamycin B lyase
MDVTRSLRQVAALLGALAVGAALVPAISEYRVPTKGAFPHDPAVDQAGRVYFTEMEANKIGRFDPASAAFSEFRVPTHDSGPHGIMVGPHGIVTFTEIRGNKIGRFDPEREAFHEFPTGEALEPHTPVLTPDGSVFFTAPGSDAIGRLDPASGAVATFAVPTPNAVPYGIKLGPDRALYFTEFGSNKIGRFDLETHQMREFTTPTAASSPRRLWFRGDDLYFTEFGAGRLGRLNVRDHEIKEWLSPGGAGSMPYGIALDRSGQVWYEETASGMMVHFDPARQRFTTLALASRSAVIRNMDLAPDGRIWMALSGVDRIGVLSPQ